MTVGFAPLRKVKILISSAPVENVLRSPLSARAVVCQMKLGHFFHSKINFSCPLQ